MRLAGKPDIDRTYLLVNRENHYPEEDSPSLHTSLDRAYKDESLINHEVGFRPKRGTIALTEGS